MSSFLRLFRFFSGFKRVPYLVGNTRVLFISEGQSSALAKDQEEDPILLWHQADTAKVNKHYKLHKHCWHKLRKILKYFQSS